jgi:mono/diheme cytochrome c family protein
MMLRACALLLAMLAAAPFGCGARAQERAYEYMPDMARSPAYKAFSPNPVTRDGLTLQPPVPGTLARGQQPFHYLRTEADAIRAGSELTNPHRPTAAVLQQGKALYETTCLICHGTQGTGDGPIAVKIPAPPSYTSERLMAFPPGRLFHVVTLGAGRMPSHAGQLSPDERWKVVTYVYSSLQRR